MADSYTIPAKVHLARAVLRPAFRLLFHLLASVKISGQENVPQKGAYLIAFNHISTFDPPFVVVFWPVAPEALGAAEIWERPGQSTLARLYGGIPVCRGEADRRLLEKMIRVLEAGRPLVIAPEGGRSHAPGMRRGLPGVAYVAEKAHVPVLPVGIIGTTDDFMHKALRLQRPLLEMRIGQPVTLPSIEGREGGHKQALQENVDLLMRQIAALLPPEYRGVYA